MSRKALLEARVVCTVKERSKNSWRTATEQSENSNITVREQVENSHRTVKEQQRTVGEQSENSNRNVREQLENCNRTVREQSENCHRTIREQPQNSQETATKQPQNSQRTVKEQSENIQRTVRRQSENSYGTEAHTELEKCDKYLSLIADIGGDGECQIRSLPSENKIGFKILYAIKILQVCIFLGTGTINKKVIMKHDMSIRIVSLIPQQTVLCITPCAQDY